eukprot:3947223-Amphidinium_carterae.1
MHSPSASTHAALHARNQKTKGSIHTKALEPKSSSGHKKCVLMGSTIGYHQEYQTLLAGVPTSLAPMDG